MSLVQNSDTVLCALTSHPKYRKHQNVQNDFAEEKFARLCFKPSTEPLVGSTSSSSSSTSDNSGKQVTLQQFLTPVRYIEC